jgi:cytidylate kinase
VAKKENVDERIIIAVDGYSSCGKSTLSKDLAKKLQYVYIDSGAMYRAVGLYCMQQGIDTNNEDKVVAALPKIKINFKYNSETNNNETYLNGKNVEAAIRNLEVAALASAISKYKKVREALVAQQQLFGKEKGVVMDGRDIGTVVFPDAELKLFITANIEVRTERRYKELAQKGIITTKEKVAENLKERDDNDIHRTESPLRKADDAKEIDNSFLTMEEQLNLACYFTNEVIKNIQAK